MASRPPYAFWGHVPRCMCTERHGYPRSRGLTLLSLELLILDSFQCFSAFLTAVGLAKGSLEPTGTRSPFLSDNTTVTHKRCRSGAFDTGEKIPIGQRRRYALLWVGSLGGCEIGVAGSALCGKLGWGYHTQRRHHRLTSAARKLRDGNPRERFKP